MGGCWYRNSGLCCTFDHPSPPHSRRSMVWNMFREHIPGIFCIRYKDVPSSPHDICTLRASSSNHWSHCIQGHILVWGSNHHVLNSCCPSPIHRDTLFHHLVHTCSVRSCRFLACRWCRNPFRSMSLRTLICNHTEAWNLRHKPNLIRSQDSVILWSGEGASDYYGVQALQCGSHGKLRWSDWTFPAIWSWYQI